MKRWLLSILVLLYIVVSTGVTVNFHYCMGILSDFKLGTIEDTCSSCGQKQTSAHCCSTEAHFIKLAVDQNTVDSSVIDFAPAVLSVLSNLWGDFQLPVIEKDWNASSSMFHFFRQREVPLFIYHCLLLI